jgi:membrane protein implicated in regulation of membrane protease activity
VVNGVTHSRGQFATTLVPIVAVAIMTAWGWKAISHLFAVVGIAWSVFWWAMYRELPEEHKRVNAAEAAYIREGRQTSALAGNKKVRSRGARFCDRGTCGSS